MLDALLGPLWQYVAGAAGLAAVAVGWLLRNRSLRRQGAAEQRARDAERANEQVEKGRKAVAAGRGSGTPDERLRNNDGRWK